MGERFAARSGAAIYLEDTGAGPPIVALHGLGGGAWFFAGLARRLASDCRLIALDLPGTGRSAGPPAAHADAGRPPSVVAPPPGSESGELSVARWVADIGELIAGQIGEPVVLLGHSLGTILALHAVAAWPQQIRALIFVGGLPEARPLIKERLTQRAEAVARAGLEGAGPRAAAANLSAATLQQQPELVALFERVFEAQDPAVYVRCCRILIEASAWTAVPAVRVPCLSISGTEDQYAPPDLVTEFVRALPDCQLELLPDCGHLPFLERPEEVAARVKSFVQRVC